MSQLADEDAKQCPPNVYSQTQIYPGYPPPYQDYAPPYHGGTSNKYNPAYASSNKLPFPTTEPKESNTFGRVVLCLMVGLIFGASLLSLLLWVLFGSDVPIFEIQTFSIPSFNFTGSTLKASWEAGLNVINPNHKLDISFEQTESSLVYNNYIIDTSLVDSFQVERDEETTMDTGFFVPAFDDEYYNTTGSPWVKDMQEERRKGSLAFELRIITTATFMAGDFWRRQTALKVVCIDLKVDFPATTGGGTWNGDKKNKYGIVNEEQEHEQE
ncbi:hydroxyproline-rich glycoprotein family protein [Forsythia ovata]|uniref:Hydroxyproline-rich glycoprotein family protein n=1 Tax=Forsythia ovata TaxID=205694 RepID=A0ABD1VJG5_9LAMI